MFQIGTFFTYRCTKFQTDQKCPKRNSITGGRGRRLLEIELSPLSIIPPRAALDPGSLLFRIVSWVIRQAVKEYIERQEGR
jgi:hypothetical protein